MNYVASPVGHNITAAGCGGIEWTIHQTIS